MFNQEITMDAIIQSMNFIDWLVVTVGIVFFICSALVAFK